MNYYVNFLGRLGSNEFQLKWRFGYQLNTPAISAHLAHFCGKWAGLALLFSW
jgi:hypothetical protein